MIPSRGGAVAGHGGGGQQSIAGENQFCFHKLTILLFITVLQLLPRHRLCPLDCVRQVHPLFMSAISTLRLLSVHMNMYLLSIIHGIAMALLDYVHYSQSPS